MRLSETSVCPQPQSGSAAALFKVAHEALPFLPPLEALDPIWCQETQCSQYKDAAQKRLCQGEIRWAQDKAESLDPAMAISFPNIRLGQHLYETLLRLPNGDKDARPGLASHYDVSADGKVYTLHLRPGLQWSDGKPLTSADVLFSWQRTLKRGRATDLFQHVKGAESFASHGESNFSSVGFKALDALTVQIELSKPLPTFPQLLAMLPWAPVPKHMVEKWGDEVGPSNAFGESHRTQLVTSGPFTVDQAVSDKELVLRRNPYYWRNAQNAFHKAVVYFSSDSKLAYDFYQVGKVDWTAENMSPDLVDVARRDGVPGIMMLPTDCAHFLYFNTKRAPFNTVEARRGVAQTMDRERMAAMIGYGTRVPERAFIPKTLQTRAAYQSLFLEEGGFGGSAAMRTMGAADFIFSNDDFNKTLMETVQEQLRRGGAQLDVTNMEHGMFVSRLTQHDFAANHMFVCPDYPDASFYLGWFRSTSFYNFGQYNNPQYDAILATLDATADQATRNVLMRQAEEMLVRDVPGVPLLDVKWAMLVRPPLTGFVESGSTFFRADDLRMAGSQ